VLYGVTLHWKDSEIKKAVMGWTSGYDVNKIYFVYKQ
jgi:hypothetical protein